MTYQVLARKWRPRSFDQLVGQNHITAALSHALSSQKFHHAYLFSGTRGVGKTTIARIVAKCLNCEQGVVAEPCGQCSACQAVDEGRHPDLIEVDAASRTKVEDTRELLDNVVYAPSSGRYKIYLIDEVHMLSGHSFNALLKTLEEPPAHVVFLFATTDPEKLPATVLSRCLQFQLRPIGLVELEQQLSTILTEEGYPFEQEAVSLLSQSAQGSLRDALSLTEQAIGLGQGKVEREPVEQMLGCHYGAYLTDLLKHILAQDSQALIDSVQQMSAGGIDFAALLDAMLATFHGWAVCLAVPDQAQQMTTFAGVRAEAIALYQGQSPEQVQLYYQIALRAKQDLALAPSTQMGFEMACLRLMHFKPYEPGQAPQAKQPKTAPAPAPVPKTTPKATPKAQAPQKPVPPKPKPAPSVPDAPNWAEVSKHLQLVGLAKVLVQNCVVHMWQLPKVRLVLDARQSVCLNEDRRQKIEKALGEYLQQPIDLVIQAGDVGEQSPQKQVEVKQKAQQTKAQQLLQEDAQAQKLIDSFDGVVEHVSLNKDES